MFLTTFNDLFMTFAFVNLRLSNGLSTNVDLNPCAFPVDPDGYERFCYANKFGFPHICDPQRLLSYTEAEDINRLIVRQNMIGCVCINARSGDSIPAQPEFPFCDPGQHYRTNPGPNSQYLSEPEKSAPQKPWSVHILIIDDFPAYGLQMHAESNHNECAWNTLTPPALHKRNAENNNSQTGNSISDHNRQLADAYDHHRRHPKASSGYDVAKAHLGKLSTMYLQSVRQRWGKGPRSSILGLPFLQQATCSVDISILVVNRYQTADVAAPEDSPPPVFVWFRPPKDMSYQERHALEMVLEEANALPNSAQRQYIIYERLEIFLSAINGSRLLPGDWSEARPGGQIMGMPLWAFLSISACIVFVTILTMIGHCCVGDTRHKHTKSRSSFGAAAGRSKWQVGFAGGMWDAM